MLSSAQSLGACTFIQKRDSSFNQTVLTFNPKTSLSSYNCWIWLDSDDLRTAGAVTTWTDKSGKGYHCTQSAASNKPTIDLTNMQNKRPTLRFNSTNSQYLQGPTEFAIGTNTFYLFVVSKFNDTAAGFQSVFSKSLYGFQQGRLWMYRDNNVLNMGIADNPDLSRFTDASVDLTFNIYVLACNRATAKTSILYKNGSLAQTRTISVTDSFTNPNCILVGAYNTATGELGPHPTVNTYLNGNIAEVIGYSQAIDMTETDIKRVEGYLAWKWGLQTKLPTNHPHYSAQPT